MAGKINHLDTNNKIISRPPPNPLQKRGLKNPASEEFFSIIESNFQNFHFPNSLF
jgi:hypothetical protein